MKKNPEDYIAELVGAQQKRWLNGNGSERKGQALFNALFEIDPEAADRIIGTSADPFYNDALIPNFWRELLS